MVPLANAWRTGAARWTDDQRSAFANDLTRPATARGVAVEQPVQGRPGPVPVEAAEPDLLVRVRAALGGREELLEAQRDHGREGGAARHDVGDRAHDDSARTDVTAGPGGVMTDEVGVVTGELTVRTEAADDGSAALEVAVPGTRDEWYTVTGGPTTLGRGRQISTRCTPDWSQRVTRR